MGSLVLAVRPRRRWAAAALALVLLGAPALGAAAESAPSAQTIDLPAMALDAALLALAEEYGVTLIAPAELVGGKTAPAVAGTLPLDDAVARVLVGSGLSARRTDSGAWVVAEAVVEGPVESADPLPATDPPTSAPPPAPPQATAPSPAPPTMPDLSAIPPVVHDVTPITIFGTKEERTRQDSVVSVDVFTEERLERESIVRLDDLIERTPNVQSFGPTTNLTIRGIGGGPVADNVEGSGATNVFVDGAPVSSTALDGGCESLWDLQQVEVLRGPQSAVQGRNSLAGAINLVTRDASYEWESRARARLGGFETRRYAGVVSGPIIPEQLAFRAAADYQSTDGHIDYALSGDDFDWRRNVLFRGKILAEPRAIEGLRVDLGYEYSDCDRGARGSFVNANLRGTDPRFVGFDFRDGRTFNDARRNDVNTWRATADVSYELLDELTLRLIGTYEDAQRDQLVGDVANPGFANQNIDADQSHDTYTAEMRLEFDFDRVAGFLGGYYFRSDFDSDELGAGLVAPQVFPLTVDPPDSIASFSLLRERDIENWAAFARLEVELADRLRLDLGFRWDDEAIKTRTSRAENLVVTPESCTLFVGPFPTGSCRALVELNLPQGEDPTRTGGFGVWLPQGALTFFVNDDVSVFVSAQRGYRAGGTFFLATDTGQFIGEFDPEFARNYEVGFRSQWLERRLTLNGNAFYTQYRDRQVTLLPVSGVLFGSEVVNIGRSTHYGFELDASYRVSDALEFWAAFGFLRATIDEFPFGVVDLEGNDSGQAPRTSFTLGGSYEHSSGFFVDKVLTFTDSFETNFENLDQGDLGPGLDERVDTTVFGTLRAGFRHEYLEVYGVIENLYGEDSFLGENLGSRNRRTGGVTLFTNPSKTPPRPRTFSVVLELRY